MKITQIKSAIYNNVWHAPKTRLSGLIKRKCEELPPKRRITAVTILLTAFILTAFFVFGHACYRIGLGHRSKVDVQHIHQLDITKSNPSKPDVHELAR